MARDLADGTIAVWVRPATVSEHLVPSLGADAPGGRLGVRVWEIQQAMLLASARALRLVAEGQIVPRGRLGAALRPGPDQYVYDGDRPGAPPQAWSEAMAKVEEVIEQACTDSDTARRLLALLTHRCRSRDRFEETRAYLFGAGIQAAFLPTPTELGRTDLA